MKEVLLRVIANLLIFFLALIISILLSEVFLRIVWTGPRGIDLSSITLPDKSVIYRFIPNSQASVSSPMNDYTTLININSYGFRGEEEIDVSSNRQRVLLFGDSEIFGVGVSEDNMIDAHMEKLLNKTDSKYNVINIF